MLQRVSQVRAVRQAAQDEARNQHAQRLGRADALKCIACVVGGDPHEEKRPQRAARRHRKREQLQRNCVSKLPQRTRLARELAAVPR